MVIFTEEILNGNFIFALRQVTVLHTVLKSDSNIPKNLFLFT